MEGYRARDADRERHVDLIEAAYVDGQLGEADRELRVSRALSAETLGELETLTRDLQGPDTSVDEPPVRAVARSRSRHVAGILGGLGVFVALVAAGVTAVAALFMFGVSGGSDTATSGGIEAPPPIISEQAAAAEAFEMTPRTVRSFVQAYEEQFGTLEAYEVGFFPDRVQVRVPVRGSRPRMERWTWDGAWRQDTEARAVAGPFARVDAGAIDVRRFFANIASARRTMQVENGRFTHALLVRWGDEPAELTIYIGNDHDETGHLSTTPEGDVVRKHPYQP
jgi:hypothetical protein